MSYSDLSETSPHPKRESESYGTCEVGQCSPKQDKRLENWESWQKKREETEEFLQERTHRDQSELLMNATEDSRLKTECQTVLEYAQLDIEHDKYRGNPSFWKMGTPLVKINDENQVYFSTLSKTDRCEMPSMTYVDVPKVVREEKHTNTTRKFNWFDNEYFKQRILDEKVQLIEPHRPELSNLAVVGLQLSREPPLSDRSSTTHATKSVVETGSNASAKPPKCYLTINDMHLHADCEGVRKTTLFFNDFQLGKIETCHLLIENNSNIALRFTFSKFEEPRILTKALMNAKITKQVFFYNKKIQIIQPGETLNFPFWLKATFSRPYSETLKLNLQPDFWSGTLKILINLKADEINNDLIKKSEEIIEKIDNRVRTRLIQEVFESLLTRIPFNETHNIKIYTYDKATIFEAVNSIYDPLHFRPKYLYDKRVVDELEDFYNQVKMDHHTEQWDYRLDTLRIVTKDRENFEESNKLSGHLKAILARLEDCKAKRLEMSKKLKELWIDDSKLNKNLLEHSPPQKGSPTSAQSPSSPSSRKTSPVRGDLKRKGSETKIAPIEEPKRKPIPTTVSDLLENIISKLKTPCTWKNDHQRRLLICYNLLSCYIDRIVREADDLSAEFNVKLLHDAKTSQLHVSRTRLFNENLESCTIEMRHLSERGKSSDKPAPSWITEIPLNEFEQRYKAYEETLKRRTVPGKGGGKEGPKRTSVTSRAKSRTSRRSAGTFGDRASSSDEVGEAKKDESSQAIETPLAQISDENLQHYRNNLYLIFHNYLNQFINDMVAIFELDPKPQIPQNVLERIQNTQFDQIQEDPSLKIRIIDLKKAISDVFKYDDKSTKRTTPSKKTTVTDASTIDVIHKESSVWSLLQGYYVRKEPSVREEVITERNIQVDLCGGGEPKGDGDEEPAKEPVCECEPLQLERSNSDVSQFYQSDISFAHVNTQAHSSDDNDNTL